MHFSVVHINRFLLNEPQQIGVLFAALLTHAFHRVLVLLELAVLDSPGNEEE